MAITFRMLLVMTLIPFFSDVCAAQGVTTDPTSGTDIALPITTIGDPLDKGQLAKGIVIEVIHEFDRRDLVECRAYDREEDCRPRDHWFVVVAAEHRIPIKDDWQTALADRLKQIDAKKSARAISERDVYFLLDKTAQLDIVRGLLEVSAKSGLYRLHIVAQSEKSYRRSIPVWLPIGPTSAPSAKEPTNQPEVPPEIEFLGFEISVDSGYRRLLRSEDGIRDIPVGEEGTKLIRDLISEKVKSRKPPAKPPTVVFEMTTSRFSVRRLVEAIETVHKAGVTAIQFRGSPPRKTPAGKTEK